MRTSAGTGKPDVQMACFRRRKNSHEFNCHWRTGRRWSHCEYTLSCLTASSGPWVGLPWVMRRLPLRLNWVLPSSGLLRGCPACLALKMGSIGSSETSVSNHQTPRNNPEDGRTQGFHTKMDELPCECSQDTVCTYRDVHHLTGHDGPKGMYRYNPTLSLTSVLDGGGGRLDGRTWRS
jgi:hypothetical protein